MVKKWIKQLVIISKSSGINFDIIIDDILNGEYMKYDFKDLSGYENLYRIRIGGYRVIFRNENNETKVLLVGKRGDVYKRLKQMFG